VLPPTKVPPKSGLPAAVNVDPSAKNQVKSVTVEKDSHSAIVKSASNEGLEIAGDQVVGDSGLKIEGPVSTCLDSAACDFTGS